MHQGELATAIQFSMIQFKEVIKNQWEDLKLVDLATMKHQTGHLKIQTPGNRLRATLVTIFYVIIMKAICWDRRQGRAWDPSKLHKKEKESASIPNKEHLWSKHQIDAKPTYRPARLVYLSQQSEISSMRWSTSSKKNAASTILALQSIRQNASLKSTETYQMKKLTNSSISLLLAISSTTASSSSFCTERLKSNFLAHVWLGNLKLSSKN